ncbi:TetR/AcrR family transcriptional regulator [Luteimonas yindakuii]|uniref:TetR/AcrR family transcriptional regulator n=2 Tax=Luteimonas yindakuii TaxID=2565782 RepID=A0A4Z1RH14_9GAMM|nr:TetR/AcrR family transcriptional regulator [Luteimonas yindakuii]
MHNAGSTPPCRAWWRCGWPGRSTRCRCTRRSVAVGGNAATSSGRRDATLLQLLERTDGARWMNARPRSEKAEARAEAQRKRILDAAQHCFIEHGFHGASMAAIAETAQMSAGLIYRYFESKSAIILAIVEEQLVLLRADIGRNTCPDFAVIMTNEYGRSYRPEGRGMNAALLLEISAEATRDPQIAAALDDYDTTVRDALHDWLTRAREAGGHALADDAARRRALMLQCLIEGLKLRETREPGLDRALLFAALQDVVPRLLDAELR